MTVKVNIDLKRNFIVSADVHSVFTFLSNVPASVEHFPKVEALIALPNNSFRWEMQKIGLGTHSIQTSYACQYISDSDANTIEWIPIKGEGNGIVSGKWELTEVASGTSISFNTKAELTLPLPGLLKLAISPVVKMEFSGMVDTYLRNIQKLWS